MVNGTDNPAVTLQVGGVAGGNATVGTAVSNPDGSITYTAPAVVPTPSNVVPLTITSVDNPTVSLTQNISVMNPIPILTTATPLAFDPGSATSRADRLEIHHRRASAGGWHAGFHDVQQRYATDGDAEPHRARAILIFRC